MKLIEMLAATYAALNQQMPDAALEIIARDLSAYPIEDVAAALTRARKEVKRLALVDILDRIPGGHPGPEEAWAMCAKALNDERLTLVWTEQMRAAFGVALGLQDDPVAARMAFKESYQRLVSEIRETHPKPSWTVSLGFDVNGREGVMLEAVRQGRLTMAQVDALLPAPKAEGAIVPSMRKPQ